MSGIHISKSTIYKFSDLRPPILSFLCLLVAFYLQSVERFFEVELLLFSNRFWITFSTVPARNWEVKYDINKFIFSTTVLVGRAAKNCAKCILATTKIGPFSVAPQQLLLRFPVFPLILGNLPKLRTHSLLQLSSLLVNANICVLNSAKSMTECDVSKGPVRYDYCMK